MPYFWDRPAAVAWWEQQLHESRARERERERGGEAPAAEGASHAAAESAAREQLDEAEGMLDDGLIDEAEYEQYKAKVLRCAADEAAEEGPAAAEASGGEAVAVERRGALATGLCDRVRGACMTRPRHVPLQASASGSLRAPPSTRPLAASPSRARLAAERRRRRRVRPRRRPWLRRPQLRPCAARPAPLTRRTRLSGIGRVLDTAVTSARHVRRRMRRARLQAGCYSSWSSSR